MFPKEAIRDYLGKHIGISSVNLYEVCILKWEEEALSISFDLKW